MVDRFHDSNVRSPVLQAGRSNRISTPNDFFRPHDQKNLRSPRLHRWAGVRGYMDITDLREQPETGAILDQRAAVQVSHQARAVW